MFSNGRPTLHLCAVHFKYECFAVILVEQAQPHTHLNVGGLQQQTMSTLQRCGTRNKTLFEPLAGNAGPQAATGTATNNMPAELVLLLRMLHQLQTRSARTILTCNSRATSAR